MKKLIVTGVALLGVAGYLAFDTIKKEFEELSKELDADFDDDNLDSELNEKEQEQEQGLKKGNIDNTEMLLEALGLRKNIISALKSEGIFTVNQFKSKTDEELLAISNIGQKTIDMIREVIKDVNEKS